MNSEQQKSSEKGIWLAIKGLIAKQETLEDQIFGFILIVGTIITVISMVVTCIEELSAFATVSSVVDAIFFAFLIILTYGVKKQDIARVLLCYFLNCFLLPVTFFSCGGIDSCMPLYLLAGVFMIVPVLKGKKRLVCFMVSLLMDASIIGFSYNFMEGTKAKYKFESDILAELTLEDRIIDMTASIILVAICLFTITTLILNAYQKERENKEQLLNKLDVLSKKDELTGLFNRRELFHYLDETELFTAKRYYVAMFDIDHFKMVNDTYGHIFGDVVLRRVAAELDHTVSIENGEIASRYGGEEFVLMLREESFEAAYERVEQLRKTVEAMKWEEQQDFTVTISGGILECSDYHDVTNMLGAVDKLLYEAKHTGRNRIVIPHAA